MLVLQSFLAGETQHLPFPSWQKSGEFFFPYIFLRYVFVLFMMMPVSQKWFQSWNKRAVIGVSHVNWLPYIAVVNWKWACGCCNIKLWVTSAWGILWSTKKGTYVIQIPENGGKKHNPSAQHSPCPNKERSQTETGLLFSNDSENHFTAECCFMWSGCHCFCWLAWQH